MTVYDQKAGRIAVMPASSFECPLPPISLPKADWQIATPIFAVQRRFTFHQKQTVGLSWVVDKSRPAGSDPTADIAKWNRIQDTAQMKHEHFLIVASASLVVSACLAGLPTFASSAPAAPFIVVNWVFFITAGLMHGRRAKVVDLSYAQSKTWDRLQVATLLTFTAAATYCLSAGNPMF